MSDPIQSSMMDGPLIRVFSDEQMAATYVIRRCEELGEDPSLILEALGLS